MSQQSPSEPGIALHFEKFSAFVEGYASNLSLGGMFFETDADRPVGSIVNFEIKLIDGFRLMQGIGEVIWIRRTPAGPDRPAGLGVRFQDLDDKGRELILKILEERVRSGLEPFDVEEIPDDLSVGGQSDERLDAEGDLTTGVPGDPAASDPAASEPAASEPAASKPATSGENLAPPKTPESASDAAVVAPLIRSPEDFEQKILGEDGFTLLDTEEPEPVTGAIQPDEDFAQVEFDAPWGKALPEFPEEVLAESSKAVEDDAMGDSLASGDVARDGRGNEQQPDSGASELDAAIAEGEAATSGLDSKGPAEDDALEASFFLAAEAVAEIDTSPPSEDALGEPDFEDIDFSVDSEEGDESPILEAGTGGADFAFDPDPEDQLPALEPVTPTLESMAAPAPAFESSFTDSLSGEDPTIIGGDVAAFEEDPTVLTSEPLAREAEAPAGDFELDFTPAGEVPGVAAASDPAPVPSESAFNESALDESALNESAFNEPALDESAFNETALDESAFNDPASKEPAARAPDEGTEIKPPPISDPIRSIPESETAAGPATVSVAGVPGEVQDYEDDLFAGESGSGPGQVVRQALSGRALAGIAVLLALAAGAYFFRGPIGELVGLTESRIDSSSQATGGPPPEIGAGTVVPSAGTSAPPDTADGLVTEASNPTTEEVPEIGAVPVIEDVEVSETLPPGSNVGSDPAAQPGEGLSGGEQTTAAPTIKVAAPALEPPTASASLVEQINWRRGEDGTLVTVSLDGRLDDSRFLHMPLDYNQSREMVKITGIDEPYVKGRIEVGSPEIQQIRIGHHTRAGGPEIHVVFDYPSAGPRVISVRNLGDRLEVLVAGP